MSDDNTQYNSFYKINSKDEQTKIATTNIRGLNEEFKQIQLQNYIEEQKITIMGLSETKFNKDKWSKTLNSKNYKAYWENRNTRGEG